MDEYYSATVLNGWVLHGSLPRSVLQRGNLGA